MTIPQREFRYKFGTINHHMKLFIRGWTTMRKVKH